MNSDIAIQTTQLCRYFGSVHAVERLSLTVPAGIIFGFLGPNGSGKTTTIRLLLGLLEPTSGNGTVLGYNICTQADEIREICGALLEHPGLYERLSAADNLEFYARIWKLPRPSREQRIQELLKKLDLWERRNDLVAGWSRGMKQKLAIARALLHRPRLVFMDEPTAGLDPQAAASLRKDLMRLAEDEGVTIFLTTHNLAEAESICHQVAVIRQGQLLAVGSPDTLKQNQKQTRVLVIGSGFSETILQALRQRPEIQALEMKNGNLYLEFKEESSLAPIVTFLVSCGAQIEEVRKERASLEEVFLTLMEEA